MSDSRRRFGRVRKLPSGRWQARYAGPDGVDRSAPTTFATRGDAGRYLASVEVDMGRGVWLDPHRGSATLRDYALAWIDSRTVKGRPLSPRTRSDYRALLDLHLAPTLGKLPLAKITPERVRLWHAEIAKVGAATCARCYRLLHAILATATTEGSFARNPCQIRGGGQTATPKRPLVIVEDVDALAAAMPEHLRALVVLGFWGALRLGELLGLEYGDVHLDVVAGTGTVHVRRQQQEIRGQAVIGPAKADSNRTVHLPSPAVAALAEHVATAGPTLPSARLFVRQSGEQLRAWDVHRYWNRARLAADLPGLHLHDLRHGGLTLATQSGASLAEVMRRAGHASSRAALIYQHAADDRDALVAAQMTELAGTTKTLRARSGHAAVVDLHSRV